MSNSDFANYWYLLKGSAIKGIEAVRHILSSETEAVEFVTNPGAMTVALGFDWNDTSKSCTNDRVILDLLHDSPYWEKALTTYVSYALDINNPGTIEGLLENDKSRKFITSDDKQIYFYDKNDFQYFSNIIDAGVPIDNVIVESVNAETVISETLKLKYIFATNLNQDNFPKTKKIINFMKNISHKVNGNEHLFKAFENLPGFLTTNINGYPTVIINLLKIGSYDKTNNTGFIFYIDDQQKNGTYYRGSITNPFTSEMELNAEAFNNKLTELINHQYVGNNTIIGYLLKNANDVEIETCKKNILILDDNEPNITTQKLFVPSIYEMYGQDKLPIFTNNSFNAISGTGNTPNVIIKTEDNTEYVNYIHEGKNLNLKESFNKLMNKYYKQDTIQSNFNVRPLFSMNNTVSSEMLRSLSCKLNATSPEYKSDIHINYGDSAINKIRYVKQQEDNTLNVITKLGLGYINELNYNELFPISNEDAAMASLHFWFPNQENYVYDAPLLFCI